MHTLGKRKRLKLIIYATTLKNLKKKQKQKEQYKPKKEIINENRKQGSINETKNLFYEMINKMDKSVVLQQKLTEEKKEKKKKTTNIRDETMAVATDPADIRRNNNRILSQL